MGSGGSGDWPALLPAGTEPSDCSDAQLFAEAELDAEQETYMNEEALLEQVRATWNQASRANVTRASGATRTQAL